MDFKIYMALKTEISLKMQLFIYDIDLATYKRPFVFCRSRLCNIS